MINILDIVMDKNMYSSNAQTLIYNNPHIERHYRKVKIFNEKKIAEYMNTKIELEIKKEREKAAKKEELEKSKNKSYLEAVKLVRTNSCTFF
tara:strand:- start:24 stop:299 length:276 start_codon:yes stop_codon:yes gene_type:complete